MDATFQETVKEIVQWLNIGETTFFNHPRMTVKVIEPDQLLVLDDDETPEVDKNRINIPVEIAQKLVAKVCGITDNNTGLAQSVLNSTVGRGTGILIPVEHFSQMLFTGPSNQIKLDQSPKFASNSDSPHIAIKQGGKALSNILKPILPSRTAQMLPSTLTTTGQMPTILTSKSSCLKPTTQTSKLQNGTTSSTSSYPRFLVSEPAKKKPQATPFLPRPAKGSLLVSVPKPKGPVGAIWNPLTPSPNSNDVMLPEQNENLGQRLPSATSGVKDISVVMTELDAVLASRIKVSKQTKPVGNSNIANPKYPSVANTNHVKSVPRNQVIQPVFFPASNANQMVYQPVGPRINQEPSQNYGVIQNGQLMIPAVKQMGKSPKDRNVYKVVFNTSGSGNQIPVQNGQIIGHYTFCNEAPTIGIGMCSK